MMFYVQSAPTCTSANGQPCETVTLDPQTLQTLLEHQQANTMYEATILCFILLCVSGLTLVSIFGRG